jgi:hypothetical protein
VEACPSSEATPELTAREIKFNTRATMMKIVSVRVFCFSSVRIWSYTFSNIDTSWVVEENYQSPSSS